MNILMVFTFLAAIFNLFYLMLSSTMKWKLNKILNIFFFLSLFTLLNILYRYFEVFAQEGRVSFDLVWLTWLAVISSVAVTAFQFFVWWKKSREELSDNSIKLAIDTLPIGICFFEPSGRAALCNHTMNHIYYSLTGTNLRNLQELESALDSYNSKAKAVKLSDERQTYLFPSGKVWKATFDEMTASNGITYGQVVFSDMTDLYLKSLELKKQTDELEIISKKLEFLNENISEISKDREILETKTKIHNQMGQGLLAVRQALNGNVTDVYASDAVNIFKNVISSLKNEDEYSHSFMQFDDILKDAEAIGVKIVLKGDLPKHEKSCKVFVMAVHECLTNAVRHADATEIYVKTDVKNDIFSVTITNNGKTPKSDVTMKGGLLNLKSNVLSLGGAMHLQSEPDFVLTVNVPLLSEVLR